MAGNISDQTTVLSNLSLTGTLSANTFSATSGLAANAGTFATVAATTSATVGGGTAITGIRKGTISVVTLTCTAQGSTVTQATVSPLATSDILLVSPQSSLSSGVVVHAYVSAASTVQVVFSNMSTASNVIGGPCVLNYVAIRS